MLTTGSTLYSISPHVSLEIYPYWTTSHFPFLPAPGNHHSLCFYGLSTICVYVCVCVCAHIHTLNHVLHFATPWTAACQAPLSVEFSRQKYWSGSPFPPLGDLSDPGTEPTSLAFPALSGGFFTTVPPTWLWLL